MLEMSTSRPFFGLQRDEGKMREERTKKNEGREDEGRKKKNLLQVAEKTGRVRGREKVPTPQTIRLSMKTKWESFRLFQRIDFNIAIQGLPMQLPGG